MRGKTAIASALSLAAAAALMVGGAQASHVRIGPAPVVLQTTVVAAREVTVPETLQVDEIKAQTVRARTIYANRIEADQVQGMIHQTSGLKVRARGEIKAPEVMASVIYADSISANTVVADTIYVRELKMK